MNGTGLKYILATGVSISALGLFGGAVAQETPEDGEVRRLNPVTVTATKRDESIQDVPIAVTALDPIELDRAGVTDIGDLASVSASFNMSQTQTESGGSIFRIRGVGTTGNNVGLESAVGVFLDGVYIARPGVALQDLVDLEQLEILRGPQGTLFGRNTTAGAINVKTKAPSLDETDGFANLTLGNFGLINVQGGTSVPLIEDKLAFRLSGAINQRDGILDNASLNEPTNTRDSYLLRGQLLFEPTPDLSLRFIADYSESDALCCDAVHFVRGDLGPLFVLAGLPEDGGIPVAGDRAYEDRISAGATSNGTGVKDFSEQFGFSLQLDWELDFADLTYIAAYREFSSLSEQADFRGIQVYDVGLTAPSGEGSELITHELRFQGTAFNDRLDWLVGTYYANEALYADSVLTLREDYQAYAGAQFLAAPGVLAGFGNVPLQTFAGGVSADGNFAQNIFDQSGDNFSIFTHNIFGITEDLSLTIGLRYVDESKDGQFEQPNASSPACNAVLDNVLNGSVPGAFAPGAIGLSCFPFAVEADLPASVFFPLPRTFDETFEDDELIYTASVGYQFTDLINGYVSFSHGFKSGGFNLDPTGAVVLNGGDVLAGMASGMPVAPKFSSPSFESEIVDALEIGLKAEYWDGRTRTNIAIYHLDIENLQQLAFNGVQFRTFNVPKAQTTGVEIESTFLLTDSFTISPSITYNDGRYPDDCDEGLASPVIAQLCGEPLTNASEWGILLPADYQTDLSNGYGLFLGGSLRYESDRRTSSIPFNDGTTDDIQEANTKLDLRVALSSPEDTWTLELWGRNVTDERTNSIAAATPLDVGGRVAFLQDPATYGVTLRTRF